MLDAPHQFHLFAAKAFFQKGSFGVADAVFTADLAGKQTCFGIQAFHHLFDGFMPMLVRHAVLTHIDVQVAVARVAEGADAHLHSGP